MIRSVLEHKEKTNLGSVQERKYHIDPLMKTVFILQPKRLKGEKLIGQI